MKPVFVDIDIPLDKFMEYNLRKILMWKIVFCTAMLGVNAVHSKIGRSRNGNVHLALLIDKEIDPVTMIQLKYCLGEDHKRLTHTIRRYEKTGKILDFLWINRRERKTPKCIETCGDK